MVISEEYMLICPVCSEKLELINKSFVCNNGHSFDLARSGYCNLLTGTKSGDFIGDSKEMVNSRRNFLESGAYEPLRNVICDMAMKYSVKDKVSILDAGCGEGYYTSAVVSTLAGHLEKAVGIDISKTATDAAAKRDKLTQYITASSYHLPVADNSIDIIMSLFAPAPAEEFCRVLKDEGKVIIAVPGREHLWELKKAIYDEPYENDEEKHNLEGFELVGKEKLCYKAHIDSPENIRALFSMTPYIHRTGRDSIEKLNALNEIDLTLSFVILVFSKA